MTMAGPGIDGFSTATATLQALRARQVSALELLELYRRRIERYNPQLNAIVVTCLERERREAEAADTADIAHTLEVNGRAVSYELQLVYPGIATLSGQPATAFPVGRTRAGLPIGLQAIGPYLEDRTPLRFAALIGQECGGYQSPPGYAEV